MTRSKFAALFLAAAIASSFTIFPASALEYNFSSGDAGTHFYHATGVGSNAAADSSTIIVGADGTIGTDEATMPNSSPLSVLDLPVGEYPNAWGIATDVAIAQNTIFKNAYAPPTQWSNVPGWSAYDTTIINSGALPTGAEEAMNAITSLTIPQQPTYATALTPMPVLTPDGAIGQIRIPSVGMNKYIYEGTSTGSLQAGIGHFNCTSGWDGNVALAGHNRGYHPHFLKLKDVQYGDLIYYTTAYGTRAYQVTSISTCATTDTSGLLQDGTNKLTMYTCKANQPSVKLMVVATLVG